MLSFIDLFLVRNALFLSLLLSDAPIQLLKELVNLLRSKIRSPQDLVLIFVARKNTCDFVSNALNRVGIRAAAMHSDRDQKHREAMLASFK